MVRGAAQYFYRVDRCAAELLASRPVGVGLLVSFHVGLGCRLAVADGLKRTAVVVDGNYTIYGTSTGLVEVYEGQATSRAWGRRCFRRLPPGLT